MFSAPVYLSIGDEYDKRPTAPPSQDMSKKPFVVSSRRHPHATDSAFGPFASLSAGDPYPNGAASHARSAQADNANSSRAVEQPPFRPTGASHKSSGKGDYYGTFSEANPPKHEPEFPPIAGAGKTDSAAPMHTKRLMYTNPPKKGTYGYTGLSIGQKGEIQYVSDPYGADRRQAALEKKANNTRQMGAPFRTSVRGGGDFDTTEHGYPKVYSLSKPLAPKKKEAPKPPAAASKPWVPGGALVREITQFPEYQEDPYDEKELKLQELRRAERAYKPWKPTGSDHYRYIYTKPIQYNPPPVA